MSRPKHPSARGGPMSRRKLLFGMANRFRGPEETADTVEGLSPLQRRGDAALAEGDPAAAAEAYRECLRKRPSMHEVRARLGYALYRGGKYLQAEVEFKRVLKKTESRLASLYLGLALVRQSKLEKAAEAWKSYFNPDEPTIMREVNVQLALIESGEAPPPEEIAASVEAAVEARRRGNAPV